MMLRHSLLQPGPEGGEEEMHKRLREIWLPPREHALIHFAGNHLSHSLQPIAQYRHYWKTQWLLAFLQHINLIGYIQIFLLMLHFIEVVVKVAVIGAGISGIGASGELSKNGVEHIIIEARNRTGGRITDSVFDGVTIQHGAELIQLEKKENQLYDILCGQEWKYQTINLFSKMQIVQLGRGQLSKAVFHKALQIYQDLNRKIEKNQAHSSKEKSIQYALDHYFGKIKNHTAAAEIAISLAKQAGLLLGADLKDLGEGMLKDRKLDQAGLYPKGGFSNFVQSIFSQATPKNVHLNQKVTKIDCSGKIVKIYTENKVFLAEKVVVTLPLGVLKKNSVEFVPELSQQRKDAINAMGFGIFNKIFVSFESPFWDTTNVWLVFITKNGSSKYPVARYLQDNGKFILCFYVSASDAVEIGKMPDEQIKADIVAFLSEFYPNATIVAKSIVVTSWNEDPLALGSFSYERIDTKNQELSPIICEPLDNKVWFAGEHCYPTNQPLSHLAFQTGVWTAGNITQLLSS